MIFLAVGTQLGFDRLVEIVDQWVAINPDENVFGQIGNGKYLPKYFEYKRFLDPLEFDQYQSDCEFIVGHAGMGTIIGGLQYGKPVVIMPRLLSMKEHRNDHQVATAKYFRNKPGIYVAENKLEIFEIFSSRNRLNSPLEENKSTSLEDLLSTVRCFVDGGNCD